MSFCIPFLWYSEIIKKNVSAKLMMIIGSGISIYAWLTVAGLPTHFCDYWKWGHLHEHAHCSHTEYTVRQQSLNWEKKQSLLVTIHTSVGGCLSKTLHDMQEDDDANDVPPQSPWKKQLLCIRGSVSDPNYCGHIQFLSVRHQASCYTIFFLYSN